MKDNNNKQKKGRFSSEVYGPIIRLLFSTWPTDKLARRIGRTEREIENYAYRHNNEPWARKSAELFLFLTHIQRR